MKNSLTLPVLLTIPKTTPSVRTLSYNHIYCPIRRTNPPNSAVEFLSGGLYQKCMQKTTRASRGKIKLPAAIYNTKLQAQQLVETASYPLLFYRRRRVVRRSPLESVESPQTWPLTSDSLAQYARPALGQLLTPIIL